jgi:hypothetical protein
LDLFVNNLTEIRSEAVVRSADDPIQPKGECRRQLDAV